jgi:hypothetical protein
MKWAAIGLGASLLALAVGALALTTRGGEQSTRNATTTLESVPVGVQIPLLTPQPSQQKSATKPARSRAKLAKPCRSHADDESDATGDDRSNTRNCRSNRSGDNRRDQAGDDQAGDNDSGDSAGDNQAGDDAGGNQP